MSVRIAVLLAAAGRGERLGGGGPKALVDVGGHPMLTWSARTMKEWGLAEHVVVVTPQGMEEELEALVRRESGLSSASIAGGGTRRASVQAGLGVLPAEEWDVLICHDAARPFARAELFAAVVEALERADGALPVLPLADTVKRLHGASVIETVDRSHLGLAQTPQAFRADVLHAAHAAHDGGEATDDAALVERAGYKVRSVPGDAENLKVTTPADLALAQAIARTRG